MIDQRGEEDHPRECGEKRMAVVRPTGAPGSPPRVRGKDRELKKMKKHSGITPASAGKSQNTVVSLLVYQDHPRECGEKLLVRRSVGWRWGSPPRVRGKVSVCGGICAGLRITPASAGKRVVFFTRKSAMKDHPRECGEKRSLLPIIVGMEGSPPRVRGKD